MKPFLEECFEEFFEECFEELFDPWNFLITFQESFFKQILAVSGEILKEYHKNPCEIFAEISEDFFKGILGGIHGGMPREFNEEISRGIIGGILREIIGETTKTSA